MATKKPIQSEIVPDHVTQLRRELEGKGWVVIAIFVVILISAFGYFSYQNGCIVDKYEKLTERVTGSEIEVKNIKENLPKR